VTRSSPPQTVGLHVAILRRPYLDRILDGAKTLECRLTRTPRAPFGRVAAGDTLYLKQSAGPFRGRAVAGEIVSQSDLTPADVDRIRDRYGDRVLGEPDYWQSKRDSRYATLIELRSVEPVDVGPALAPSHGLAWFVLPADADPVHETPLTAGAIRNRYVQLPRRWSETLRGEAITLELPDGRHVVSEVRTDDRLRWRSWGLSFEQAHVQPGDRIRLVRLDARRYRVSFPDAGR